MAETNYVMQLLKGGCEDPKGRILGAALEEFAVCAPSGARTRQIAARAKVNLAAISYYFGGKQGLYTELLRQIGETISVFHADHVRRAKCAIAERDAEAAAAIIKEMLLSRIGANEESPVYVALALIVTREEIAPTDGAKVLYAPLQRVHAVASELIATASHGRVKGADASILCDALFGQVRAFLASHRGLRHLSGRTRFDSEVVARIKRILSDNVDRILK